MEQASRFRFRSGAGNGGGRTSGSIPGKILSLHRVRLGSIAARDEGEWSRYLEVHYDCRRWRRPTKRGYR